MFIHLCTTLNMYKTLYKEVMTLETLSVTLSQKFRLKTCAQMVKLVSAVLWQACTNVAVYDLKDGNQRQSGIWSDIKIDPHHVDMPCTVIVKCLHGIYSAIFTG